MKQLIYHSQPFGFDEAMLHGILLQARRNNRRDGITGALVCRRNLYVQMIEGEQTAIDRLYSSIAADDRHTDVRLVHSDTVQQRMFPDWDMLDDTMPGVTFSMDGIDDGAIEQATPEALRAVFVKLANTVKG